MRSAILSVILFCSLFSLSCSQEAKIEAKLSPLTQKLINDLNKGQPEVLFSETEICDQKIEEIVSVDQNIIILATHTSIGISCKGVSRSIVFVDGKYKGYYQSDEIYPLKIESDTLIWVTEGGRKYKMSLKNELPRKLNFDGLVTVPVLHN